MGRSWDDLISSISMTTYVLLHDKTQVGIFYFDSNTFFSSEKVIYYENTRGFKWHLWHHNGFSVLSQNNTRWYPFFVYIGMCPICVRIVHNLRNKKFLFKSDLLFQNRQYTCFKFKIWQIGCLPRAKIYIYRSIPRATLIPDSRSFISISHSHIQSAITIKKYVTLRQYQQLSYFYRKSTWSTSSAIIQRNATPPYRTGFK